MKTLGLAMLWLLPVVLAELGAHWWMNPSNSSDNQAILECSFPPNNPNWTPRSEVYEEVLPSLRCNGGWISDIGSEDRADARVSFFKWDATETVNTLEAFKHLPEQCMGAIGMQLEKVYPARELVTSGGRLYFDSTQFRPQNGGRAVHIFKCVWVSGFPDSKLRDDALLGKSGLELRQLRLAAAATRFRPRHTRVIMGGVFGMPNEELAWKRFKKIIEKQLSWTMLDQDP